jgi:hypothetical protein
MRSLLFMALLLIAVCLAAQSGDAPKPPGPIYKVGEKGVKPPKAIFSPQPKFSEEERKRTKKGRLTKGTVLITGYVGADGKYHNARITSSLDIALDPKILEGLGTWKWEPCTKDGVPVNCYFGLAINVDLY